MPVSGLSSGANCAIDVMRLDGQDKIIVKQCIHKYTGEPGIIGTIKWIAYRIFNALKSIFGKSDWQKAKILVYKNAEKEAFRRRIIQENPRNSIEVKIRQCGVELLANTYSKRILELALLANQKKLEESQELNKILRPVSLNIVLGQIEHVKDVLSGIRPMQHNINYQT